MSHQLHRCEDAVTSGQTERQRRERKTERQRQREGQRERERNRDIQRDKGRNRITYLTQQHDVAGLIWSIIVKATLVKTVSKVDALATNRHHHLTQTVNKHHSSLWIGIIHATFTTVISVNRKQTTVNKHHLALMQIHTRFKITLFIKTKQNMGIFGLIPFIKLQNDT